MIPRLWHRVRQFFGGLRPRVTVLERLDAYRWLSRPQQVLFETMMLRDQQHGIVVLRRVLVSSPAEDPELFAAALLHDCGKGQVALWQRVAHVILPSFLEARVANNEGAEWRRAFWRLRYHPDIGADAATAAGSTVETVRLIRQQDAEEPDARLQLLQAADDA
jgi:hypothetical protein